MRKQQNSKEWNEEEQFNEQYEEQKIREKRALRIQEMKKEKARCIFIQNCIKIGVPIVAVILVAILMIAGGGNKSKGGDSTNNGGTIVQSAEASLQQEEIEKSTESQATQESTDIKNNANVENSAATQNNVDVENDVATQNNVNVENNTDTQNNTNVFNYLSTEIDNIVQQCKVTIEEENQILYSANTTENTLNLSNEIVSTNAILIDLESNNILAKKDMNTIISPASMTKVLTVLVAAEQIEESQLDDTFTMNLEITDYAYVNDCSSVGFLDQEVITVRDLFYGTILPSGGDAALGLAVYVAGSHEAFVELMNEKLEELGLSETAHVTNCVGLYDEEHYCTVYDMAMIMEAAIANDICREVMSTRTYTTSATVQHPEGITVSNWFIRRIEDKDTGGKVICAKTGYVVQSGNCAVSYANDNGGKGYVCVTANATSGWKCIYDHVALYKMFATGV